MTPVRPGAAAALAAAALAGCGGGHGHQRFPVFLQDDAELLHRSPTRVAADLDAIRDDGFTWVRVTAGWSAIAPSPRSARAPRFHASDARAYPRAAWTALDRVVRGAHARGLRVMIDVAFWAPRWAVARSGPDATHARDGVDPGRYAAFARAVARRYPGADGFTIWNEPNSELFLEPQWARTGQIASATEYRAMVDAAVPAIRTEAPRALVLIGATSSLGDEHGTQRDGRVAPLRFLRALACVDARLRPLRTPDCRRFRPLPGDGWSQHPYSPGPPAQPDPVPDDVGLADLPRLVDTLRALHAAGRTERRLDVWITEYGYQTNPPDPTRATSPAQQAAFLPQALALARATPGVASFAQFLLRDLPPRPGPTARDRWADFQSGLRTVDGRPKPAERRLRRALRGLDE